MPKPNNPRDKITKTYFYLLLFLPLSFFIYSYADMLLPFGPPVTYDILLIDQFSINKDDTDNEKQYVQAIASGNHAFLKYYFQTEKQIYYILRDAVYTTGGSEIVSLQPASEGYFIHDGYLYYVYGNEKRKTKNTIGGPVDYIIKDYKYRKLDLSTKQEIEITKNEYESLYFKIERSVQNL